MARLSFITALLLANINFSAAAAVPTAITCDKNPVVKVLSLLKASNFCSSYAPATTKTVSFTTTQVKTEVELSTSTAVVEVPLTATKTATNVETTVEYTEVEGPTETVSVTAT